MSADQWLRLIPLAGVAGVLLCFGVAAWVRASRRHGRQWPLVWGHVSALFLLSLGTLAGFSVARIAAPYSECNESRASYVVLWGTLFVSLWAFQRWWKDGEF